tara:strand:+ start:6399 stop:7157 length:759 start_codon:yes stop_codon:yes gene_type:complete
MAHKLYFDSAATRDSTLTDGTIGNPAQDVYSFSAGSTISNEDRAIDLQLTANVTSFSGSANDALQFDLGSAKTVDFMAIYFQGTEVDNLRVHADDASSGETAVQHAFTDDFSAGWNIASFTQASYRYWIVEATSGFLSPAEIFFGEALTLPIDGNSITINKPFNSFIASSYNNMEYSNKIDNEAREWTIQLPIITEENKTSLELLQSYDINLYTFLYYDDSEYHTVRLAKPLRFNQVAINTYSTTITLREEL